MNELENKFLEELDWDYLSGNTFFSDKLKLVYIATPKVLSTTMKWWFAEITGHTRQILECKDSVESSIDLKIHDTYRKVAPEVTGLSQDNIQNLLTINDLFRFALVRNPFKRIFSAWQSKILVLDPYTSERNKDLVSFEQAISSWDSIRDEFENFLGNIYDQRGDEVSDIHWRSQTDLLRIDIINYSHISKIENYQEINKKLKKILKQNYINPLKYRISNKSILKYSPIFFSDRSIEIIQELYSTDFELFGYSKNLPTSSKEYSEKDLRLSVEAINQLRSRNKRMIEMISMWKEKDLQIHLLKSELWQIKNSKTFKIRSFLRKHFL